MPYTVLEVKIEKTQSVVSGGNRKINCDSVISAIDRDNNLMKNRNTGLLLSSLNISGM